MQDEFSRQAAWDLLCEWTKSESLRRHMLAVEAAMRAYARRFDEDEERWGLAGLLHDFDYERWPNAAHSPTEEHPAGGVKILRQLGYPEDILEAQPGGLDSVVAERGREFSGGQQQRLRLVRALLADPPVLVLVEPTSAVDAHTEARIADQLARARAGRTTVVCTTSPLMLDRADHVIYLEGGRVVAEGSHRELLDTAPAYAATVTRGEDE